MPAGTIPPCGSACLDARFRCYAAPSRSAETSVHGVDLARRNGASPAHARLAGRALPAVVFERVFGPERVAALLDYVEARREDFRPA
jgi:hypothetical protein